MDATETKPLSKEAEALRIVQSYAGWTAGAGLIPLPVVDVAAVTGVQLKMLHSLSNLYGIPFQRSAAKAVIAALVGGGGSALIAAPATSLLKVIPGIGSIAGMLAYPALATASTYALGKVFIQHFEAGGTLLDFNPEEVRSYFEEQFRAAPTSTASASATGKTKP
jgi:uncharacterized protein (DUF697 family)